MSPLRFSPAPSLSYAPSLLAAITALAISLTFGAAARAQTFLPLRDTVPSLTAIGTARAEVIPNIATISLGVETERPTAAEAANDNARTAEAVVGEIKAQGIEPRDIRTVAVTLTPVYDETLDANGRVTKRTLRGYLARNAMSVRVRQMERAGSFAQKWMEKGANVFQGITFDFEDKELKYDSLRGEAVRDAMRKATSYVNALGIRLGRVIEIGRPEANGGADLPTRAMSVQGAAARAGVPVEAGVEVLTSEVQITWELVQ